MDYDKLMHWVTDYNLTSIARGHSIYFRNILKKSLAVAKDEDVIIVGDYGKKGYRVAPLLCAAYCYAARTLGLNMVVFMQGIRARDETADARLIEYLHGKKDSAVMLINISNRLGSLGIIGKSYRRYAKERRLRFISTSGVGDIKNENLYHITRALNIDYRKLGVESKRLKEVFDNAREIIVKTSLGTDIRFNVRGYKAIAIDGYYTSKGSGGNMPAGEVYIPPANNGVNGTVVIDGSSRHRDGTTLVRKPIKMEIQNSIITRIAGHEEAGILKRTIAWAQEKSRCPSHAKMIGELGIGLNPRADIIGAMVVDEKAFGTGHIAIGSNYWFGGGIYARIHLDQVFRDPVIEVDGAEIKLPKRASLL